jgi:hypothetical protein
MHKLREPSSKQVALAKSLGLRADGKSFRVLSAEISDALEIKAFSEVEQIGIVPGLVVNYIGVRNDLPRQLVVSKVAKNGYVYFKGTSKYCRPWNLRPA